MACLPQLGSVPAAYAVVAGACDWPLQSAVGLSNNDVIALRALRQFRQFRYVSHVPYVSSVTFLTLRALRWMETPLRPYQNDANSDHKIFTVSSAKDSSYSRHSTNDAVIRAFLICSVAFRFMQRQ